MNGDMSEYEITVTGKIAGIRTHPDDASKGLAEFMSVERGLDLAHEFEFTRGDGHDLEPLLLDGARLSARVVPAAIDIDRRTGVRRCADVSEFEILGKEGEQ